jgi:hypothetical protein
MKKALPFLYLLISATSIHAQTITLGPITKLAYCVGDTLIVPYQTSGTFAEDNHFFVELSNGNGSFASFTSLGNDTSMNGSMSISLPGTGSHFRVKVASSDPYITSDSSTTEIQVFAIPSPSPQANPEWVFVGDTVTLSDNEPAGTQFSWSFNDSDASVLSSQAARPGIVYSREGVKSGKLVVTSPGGCSAAAVFYLNALSCHPTIPQNVHIVTGSESGTFPFVWVKPGGYYDPAQDPFDESEQIIFVESGASVRLDGNLSRANLFYIRRGASIKSGDPSLITTAVLDSGIAPVAGTNFYCSDLTFDYSQVNASVAQPEASSISIRQSGDALFVEGEGNLEARILNLLGAEVLSKRGSGTLDLDLSPLPAGVYFAIVQSGDAREVRRIAVMH